jgi:hypothetical protein
LKNKKILLNFLKSFTVFLKKISPEEVSTSCSSYGQEKQERQERQKKALSTKVHNFRNKI